MSGRNDLNRAQRGGRGRKEMRRKNCQDTQPSHGSKKGYNVRKSMSDYIYNIGSGKQAIEFIAITKYLIKMIRETNNYGEDVGKALETGIEIDFNELMPRLQTSRSEDEDTRIIESEQFKVLDRAEIDSFVKRKDTYLSNMGNAYAMIYGQFSKAMQSQLQSRIDFEERLKGIPLRYCLLFKSIQ
jgi:hypothetical protein